MSQETAVTPETTREVVVKEYPNTTRWIEGQLILGVGNLILTNERMVFLNQIAPSEKQVEKIKAVAAEKNTSRMLNYALTLHKKNFEIPLASITNVKMGLVAIFPIPRPCLRVTYTTKGKPQTASFMFTISLLKGLIQFEVTTVMMWVWLIRKAVRYKQAESS